MKCFFVLLGLALLEGCNNKAIDEESKEDLSNIVEDVVLMVKDDEDTPQEAIKLAADIADLALIHPKKEEKNASK